jgi:hypothetical protein
MLELLRKRACLRDEPPGRLHHEDKYAATVPYDISLIVNRVSYLTKPKRAGLVNVIGHVSGVRLLTLKAHVCPILLECQFLVDHPAHTTRCGLGAISRPAKASTRSPGRAPFRILGLQIASVVKGGS